MTRAIEYLRAHAIDKVLAEKYMLGYVGEPLDGDERFRGMLSIPFISPAGCVSIKFRNFAKLGTGKKYAKHSGSGNRLYNTAAYFSAGHVIGISEGEIDAIVATERLGIPTLGVQGVDGWKEDWLPLLKDFTRVLLFGDGDQAGRDFSLGMAEKIGWRARIVDFPEGEDVSSLAAANRLAEISTQQPKEE